MYMDCRLNMLVYPVRNVVCKSNLQNVVLSQIYIMFVSQIYKMLFVS